MDIDVVVVGAGFGGLCAGLQLLRRGRRDFVILEKDDGVGGTWYANRYPGAACDVPSHLYSLSFARSTSWSRHYPPQSELHDYLERVAEEGGLRPHLRLSTEVESAEWDESAQRWDVRTQGGDRYRARVLVTATGGLSRPSVPDLPGLEDFAGPVVHSARWDPGVPIDDARVGVIGTGASAIQVVPAIVDRVDRMTVFQRTPPWILPRHDRPIPGWQRGLLRTVPGLAWAYRNLLYWRHEVRAVAFVREVPAIRRTVSARALAHLEAQVPDPELRERLTPAYTIGCKRILLSDDYYPAVARDHVDVVTSSIERVESDGVRTVDGVHHPLDVLVMCTGFQTTEDMAPFPIVGREGRNLRDEWLDGGAGYLGTMVSGFPNLFTIVGPNTGVGHTSMVFVIECQVRYVLAALDLIDRRDGQAIEVRADAQAEFNDWLVRRTDHTVWTQGGCSSWYLTADGRNPTLWPDFTLTFERRTRRPDPRCVTVT